MNLLAYPFYQWSAECLRPARAWAAATRATMSLWPPATSTPTGRMVDALCELLRFFDGAGVASFDDDGRFSASSRGVVEVASGGEVGGAIAPYDDVVVTLSRV